MNAEHRLELALYFVGVFVAGVLIGFQLAHDRWMEVSGAVAIFVLIAVAISYQTRKERRL
jgi:hypothetical protein